MRNGRKNHDSRATSIGVDEQRGGKSELPGADLQDRTGGGGVRLEQIVYYNRRSVSDKCMAAHPAADVAQVHGFDQDYRKWRQAC